eukprot:1160090-Pelagomonas_calceolata.AAC.7
MIHAPPSFQCPTCTAPPALALLQGPTHAVPPVCTTPIAVPTHAVHPPLAGYQCKKHGVQTPTARSMGSSTVCSAGSMHEHMQLEVQLGMAALFSSKTWDDYGHDSMFLGAQLYHLCSQRPSSSYNEIVKRVWLVVQYSIHGLQVADEIATSPYQEQHERMYNVAAT